MSISDRTPWRRKVWRKLVMDSILDGPKELVLILLVVIMAVFGKRAAMFCSDNTE